MTPAAAPGLPEQQEPGAGPDGRDDEVVDVPRVDPGPGDADPGDARGIADAIAEADAEADAIDEADDGAWWNGVAAWVRRAIQEWPRPSSPVVDDFEVSIAALVAQVPLMPRLVTKPLGLLDRFGAVHIGREQVGFNGDEVEWDRIVELRTQEIILVATGEALELEVAQYFRFLPPMPGKNWLVRKVAELVFSLWVMTTDRYDDAAGGPIPAEAISPTDPAPEALRSRVVSDIVYRRRTFGTTDRSPGLVSTVVAAAIPEVTMTMVQEAVRRGIPVVHEPADASEVAAQIERGRAWRERLRQVRG